MKSRTLARPSKAHIDPSAKPVASASSPYLRSRYVAVGLALLHLLLAAAVFDPTIFTGGDNGVYVALSRSIVDLGRYISIHDPVPLPHTYYPPGYPLILAAASLLGVKPWLHIKFLTVGFSVAGVVLSYFWIRRRTTWSIALMAGLILAASPGLLENSHYELSDIPFWALVTLSLWGLEAVPREARARVLLAGCAMAAAYLTRTAALPIIAAVMAWLAIERRWRQLAIFAVLALPAMAWWSYWTHAHAATNDYGNQFWYLDVYAPDLGRATPTQLLARIPANISAYGGAMIPLLFRGARGPMVFGISILVFAFAGWVLRLRRPGLSEFVFPFYGGMLLLCPPPWAGERYMLPIVPLALVYAFEAGQWMIRRARASMLMPAAGLVTAALLMVEGGSLVQRSTQASICRGGYRAGFPYSCLPPAWQDYLSIADWAETGLPADAVVISRKPGLFFALSNRRGIDIPKTSDPRKFFSIAAESAAEYLVLDRVDYLTTFYTVPVVAAYTRSFCVVRPGATEGTAVLRVLLDRPLAPTPAGEPPYVQPCDTPPKISNAS